MPTARYIVIDASDWDDNEEPHTARLLGVRSASIDVTPDTDDKTIEDRDGLWHHAHGFTQPVFGRLQNRRRVRNAVEKNLTNMLDDEPTRRHEWLSLPSITIGDYEPDGVYEIALTPVTADNQLH